MSTQQYESVTLLWPGGGPQAISVGMKLSSWSGYGGTDRSVKALDVTALGHLQIHYENGEMDLVTMPYIAHGKTPPPEPAKPKGKGSGPKKSKKSQGENLDDENKDGVNNDQRPPTADRTGANKTVGSQATDSGQVPDQSGGANGQGKSEGGAK